jgi:hypothetical protein
LIVNLRGTRALRTLVAGLILACFAGALHAQDVLHEEWHTVAAPGSAVPIERDLNISTAGNYEVVVTDLGAEATPAAPLASVHVAITQGATVLGTPLEAAGALAFNITAPADLTVRVTGAPGSQLGSGLVRIQVRPAGGGAAVFDVVDVLALPAADNAGRQVTDASFVVGTSGNYEVTLRDLAWPQAIPTLIMAVIEEGGPLVGAFNTAGANPHVQTLPLIAARPYRVFAIAVPDGTVAGVGGLYSVNVRASGGGTVVLDRSVAVGAVASLGSATLAAGAHELAVTDLEFPAALTRGGAQVVRGGQSVAATLTAGTTTFTALAGAHEVFGFAEPAAQPAGGSLRVELRPQGGAALLSAAHVSALPGSGLSAYLFDAPILAGAFRLRLADYQFPAAFTSVSAAATQGAGLLGTALDAPGETNVTATLGRVQVLAFARAPAAGGLLGLDLSPAAGTGPVPLEITQGVGRAFSSRKISINADGRYDVDLADIGFPAPFTDLAAAVTRGADRAGFIFGGGRFSFDATRGNYFVNFIALPAAATNAGSYALKVSSTPPAPVITFAANPLRATSGETVDLTWSATNATGCTASNGWTGTRAVSGTEKSAALTTTASFTLNCTGAGGNTSQTVTVEVTPAASGGSGGGGGGAFEFFTLAMLGALLAACRARRR